jgi:hypothetical protein
MAIASVSLTGNTHGSSTAATTYTIAPTGISAGNTIIVAVATVNTTSNQPTDTLGNTYVSLGTVLSSGSTDRITLWGCVYSNGASPSITCTFGSSRYSIVVWSYSGVGGFNTGNEKTNTGSSTSWTVTLPNALASGSWTLAAGGTYGTSTFPGTGLTGNLRTSLAGAGSTTPGACIMDATGLTCAQTLGTSNAWTAVAVEMTVPATLSHSPTLIQRTPSSSGGGTGVYTDYYFNFPNPTQAGDLIVVCGQYGVNASTVLSITDDHSQSYTVLTKHSDSNQTVFIAYFPNTVAGVLQINVHYGTSGVMYSDNWAGEFNNVLASLPVDSSIGNNATSTLAQPGNLTFSSAGDLVVQIAEQDSSGAVTSWAAGSYGFSLCEADRGNGSQVCQAVQWGVYNAPNALSPVITLGSSGGWNTMAVAFKPSASAQGGTAYTSIAVVDVNHYNLVTMASGTVFQPTLPATCNLGVLTLVQPTASAAITTITDSNSNSWIQIGSTLVNVGSGYVQIFYTRYGAGGAGTTPSFSPTMTVTINTGASMTLGDMHIMGINNAKSTAALDTGFGTSGLATAIGTQLAGGNVSGVSGSPTTSNGVIIGVIGVSSNQIQGVVTGYSDTTYSPQEASTGELDEMNGKAHYYNPNTSSFQFVWTTNGGAVSDWANAASAFQAPAVAFQPDEDFWNQIQQAQSEPIVSVWG